jgi:hypothetical protein
MQQKASYKTNPLNEISFHILVKNFTFYFNMKLLIFIITYLDFHIRQFKQNVYKNLNM